MRRILVALVVAGAVGGGIYGAAASLGTFTTDSLGSASTVVASCNTTASPKASYATSYSTAANSYVVTGVTVSPLDAACNGKTASMTLTGPASPVTVGGVSVGTGTVTFSIPAASQPLASAVSGVAVEIHG